MNQRQARPAGGTIHERIGEQSVRHRRSFSAGAKRVQAAHTDPELFAQWMGPRGSSVELHRFDPVTGGAFHYTVHVGETVPVGEHGQPGFSFRGSYHLVEPGRIVHSWEYLGELSITLESLEFTDQHHGGSVLVVTSTYGSVDACEQMLASGIDAGMDEDFDRLEELLNSAD